MSDASANAVVEPQVIDAGIYCTWSSMHEVHAYLPSGWREYVPPSARLAAAISPWSHPTSSFLPESYPGNGQLPGSDPETVLAQAMGPRVERGVLALEQGGIPALAEPYFIAELIRAANDWLLDRWLTGVDDRISGLMMVPTHDPSAAAREIARVGGHPRIAGIQLCGNGLGKAFGHPVFHPIYAAAASLDLPIVIEAGGDVYTDTLTHPTPGGLPLTFGELVTLQGLGLMTHFVSMIANGVFDRYRRLKVMLSGLGLAAIPWLLWRTDTQWKAGRREIPWVSRLPSDYVRESVRFATGPLPRAAGRAYDLAAILGSVEGAAGLCCFASGYPRWNADSIGSVSEVLPDEWQEAVLRDNARTFFRWE
jgi:predicted TIM-barrel fold metal-dependent hydrolase